MAKELGIVYVDTGAIYRSIGYYIYKNGMDPKDAAAVVAVLPQIRVDMRYSDDGLQHMLLNGEDVTEQIRLPEISMYASAVSAIPEVRTFLLEMQRDMARRSSVIMDGRDIGTVVLPRGPGEDIPQRRHGGAGPPPDYGAGAAGGRQSPMSRCWRK